MTLEYAIEIEKLTKRYRNKRSENVKLALDGVDLRVPMGSIFGLLGPNGAGKSTLINILAGLTVKTSGRVCIYGHDIDADARRARASIGVVPQELNMDPFFRLSESLFFCAGLYGKRVNDARIRAVMDSLGLGDVVNAYPRQLSGGMRRRFLVAKAMIHDPPILVLDEPTAGVDVELRRQIWATVKRLNHAGATVVLTTHYLEEAERLCDEIAIIQQGRILVRDSTSALLGRIKEKVLLIQASHPLSAPPPGFEDWDAECDSRGRLAIRYARDEIRLDRVMEMLSAANIEVRDLSVSEADLEDVFLSLTGLMSGHGETDGSGVGTASASGE